MTVLVGPICRVGNHAIPPAEAARVGGDELRGFICEKHWLAEQAAWNAVIEQLNNGQARETGQCCAICYDDLDTIERKTGKRSLFAHFLDGEMALICRSCSDHAVALMDIRTARGRYKHLSKEEFFRRTLIERGWLRKKARV